MLRGGLLVLSLALLSAGCTVGGSPGTTAAVTADEQGPASAAERAWGRSVDAFAARLVLDLRPLERLTGGGPKAGAIGRRLDPRIFVPGPQRRQFAAAMTALAVCRPSLDGTVPAAPSRRLVPVRKTLVQACTQLELVPDVLRDEVLRARTPTDVDADAVEEAAGRAGEGVRGVVAALTTLRRTLR